MTSSPVSTPLSHRTPGPAGRPEIVDPAGGGQQAVGGILAGDPALDRPAARVERPVGRPHRQPAGDPELLADQVDPVDQLGDRDARPGSGCSSRGSRTSRRRPAGTRRCRRCGSPPPEPPPPPPPPSARGAPASTATEGASSTSFWCRRWTEHSRSPRWTVRWCVGQDLDLHVPGPLDELLEIDAAVAERLERLGRRRGRAPLELVRRRRTTRMPFPPPPAAAFTITGIADRRREASGARAGRSSGGHRRPGTTGTPAACIRRRASVLSPMARMARRRPDEDQPRLLHRLGERRPARPGTRSPGCIACGAGRRAAASISAVDVEVALGRRRRARCPPRSRRRARGAQRGRRRSTPPPPRVPPRGRRG